MGGGKRGLIGVHTAFSGAGIIYSVPKASASNLLSVLVCLTLNSRVATVALTVITTHKVSIVDFIVKPKRSMSRRRPVIDGAIRRFANFYEMCLEFMKAWR